MIDREFGIETGLRYVFEEKPVMRTNFWADWALSSYTCLAVYNKLSTVNYPSVVSLSENSGSPSFER